VGGGEQNHKTLLGKEMGAAVVSKKKNLNSHGLNEKGWRLASPTVTRVDGKSDNAASKRAKEKRGPSIGPKYWALQKKPRSRKKRCHRPGNLEKKGGLRGAGKNTIRC